MVAARGTAPPVPLAATMCMAVHMVVARLGCKRRMVGTGWANSRPDFTNRLKKLYCHLAVDSSMAGKAAWELSRWLPTDNADYCMLINEWAWLRSCVCLF